ncbi:MAG: hypothetical protein AAB802_04645, partial [Patescibacteria group bacterium]
MLFREYRPVMLDPKFIVQNPELVKTIAKKKRVSFDVEHFINVDEKRRGLLTEVDALRAEKNEASEKISKLKRKEKEEA